MLGFTVFDLMFIAVALMISAVCIYASVTAGEDDYE